MVKRCRNIQTYHAGPVSCSSRLEAQGKMRDNKAIIHSAFAPPKRSVLSPE